MNIIMKFIFLYFSIWSRLLRFVFKKAAGVLGLLPSPEEPNNIEPTPVKKPVYIKIIEECVEKLPTILRALLQEILKKILPDFLKDHVLPSDEHEKGDSSEVIIVPEKPLLSTPSQIFWEFHKEKVWINDLYKSTSGSTFLTANEASLNLQEYYQSDKNHSLLIFHFEKFTELEETLSEHKTLDGTMMKFTTSYEYLCISLPLDQNHSFYETFDLGIFQPSQLKCLATPKGIDLDCKNASFDLVEPSKVKCSTSPNGIESEYKNGFEDSKGVKVEDVFEEPNALFLAKECLEVPVKRNFDAMVTSTDSIESCSSSNQEISKETRSGSFRKRRNRKKSNNNNSPSVEKHEDSIIKNGF